MENQDLDTFYTQLTIYKIKIKSKLKYGITTNMKCIYINIVDIINTYIIIYLLIYLNHEEYFYLYSNGFF